METRKWEELPMDCLVNVLGRVGVSSLLDNIPFVCTSWFKATLDPLCWKLLDFTEISCNTSDMYIIRLKRRYRLYWEIRRTKFLKVIVDRSAGCALVVKLPACYTAEAVTYVADNCPALKKLVLHSYASSTMLALSVVIGKFKHLESLEIKTVSQFKYIVSEIGANCESFVALSLVQAAPWAYIGEEEVMAIVTCLPKIKCLSLRQLVIKRKNLIKILKGCVELVHLDVCDCHGFRELDEELLKLASHIPTFLCSRFFDCDSDFDDSDF